MAKKSKSKFSESPIADVYRKIVGWKWFWIVGNIGLALIIALTLLFGTKFLLDWAPITESILQFPSLSV